MRRFYKILCLLLIAFCLIATPLTAQEELPDTGVIYTSDSVTEGYVLFSPIPFNVAYLIDNAGEIIHQWESDFPMLSVYLLENGDLLASVIKANNDFPIGGTGRIERYDWNNNLVWSYDFDGFNTQIHHDIELLPDGHILMSMWETLPAEEFAEWGLDPDTVPDDGGSLFYDSIIELDPSSNRIVWQWRLLDHSIQNYDDSLPNYGIPADNPHLVDLNYSHRPPNATDRSHINAIDYNPATGQIMVSAHFQSEIWIIDHVSGELVYRRGNPRAYGQGSEQDRILYNQHNPHWLDTGNILVFNNGSRNSQPFSTVLEIEFSQSDAQIVWEYRANPPESFFAMNTSGAQRLPTGNTFITDGPGGRLFEIDETGRIVWEYYNPIWRNPENPIVTPIFRATRYPLDYPAFTGQDLSQRMPLEFLIIEGE